MVVWATLDNDGNVEDVFTDRRTAYLFGSRVARLGTQPAGGKYAKPVKDSYWVSLNESGPMVHESRSSARARGKAVRVFA